MDLIIWIIFGLIVGIVPTFLMPGRDPGGFIITTALGIVGAPRASRQLDRDGEQDVSHPAVYPPDTPRREEKIRNIVDLEHAALARRSPTERLSNGVIAFSAGLFLVFHVVWFAFWILAGLEGVPGLPKFDQFPFGLLTMIVSLEAIFLARVVLISQNRMSRLADRRAHVDLQVNMPAEQELTTMLNLRAGDSRPSRDYAA